MPIKPISSSRIVPPCASENLPFREAVASVNAPRTWPNSSDSSSASGIAAQFTLMNGLAASALHACTARATNSLPVPVSPVIRTVLRVAATSSIRRTTSSSRSLRPTMP